MTTSQMLDGKRAVVFGAAGSIGSAVATEFALQGAEVFLAGRSLAGVKAVATQIGEDGGRAHAEAVDALDPTAVAEYIDVIVKQAGSIDIEFNATGPRVAEYGAGKPALDVSLDEFMLPVNTVLRSQYVTASAAARRMVQQGSGAVIFLTGSPARPHTPGALAIGAAFGAVENLMRTFALELSATGVRFACVRTSANPDSRSIQDLTQFISNAIGITPEQANQQLADGTMLKVSPRTTDTARAAAYLASDWARMVTGAVLNATAGATPD